MVWILIGVFFEVIWALGLKYATGNIIAVIGIACCVLASSLCLILACKRMEASIVYTVFVGLGTAFLTGIDMFLHTFSWEKIILIFTLLSGVIGIKYLGSEK